MKCLGVALVACAAWLLVVPGAAAAEPDRLGDLVISPATGDLDTPIDLVTAGECSRGTTFVVTVDGKGLASQRGNLVGATKIDSLGLPRYPGHYVVPVASTLREYLLRSLDRARLSGDYEIAFVCRNTLDTEPLQEFVGSLRVDEEGGFTALGPAGGEIRDLVGAEAFDRAEEADRLSREAEMAAVEPEPAEPVSSETTVESAPISADPGQASSAGIEWRTILLVVGAMLLLGAAYSWWRGRSRTDGPDADADDEPVGAAR